MAWTVIGLFLLWVGLAPAAPHPALGGLVLLMIGVELQVRRVEEPHLAHVHGTSYISYASSTGRFLPGMGKITAAAHPDAVAKGQP